MSSFSFKSQVFKLLGFTFRVCMLHSLVLLLHFCPTVFFFLYHNICNLPNGCFEFFVWISDKQGSCKICMSSQKVIFWILFVVLLAENSCGNPGTPTDGQKIGENYQYGDVVTFACNEGYNLVGSSSRTCKTDNNWDGTQPTCQSTYISLTEVVFA